MENFIKKSGWSSVVSSVILALLGIVLIAKPEGTLKVVSCILATIFLVLGGIKIVEFFASKGNYDFYNYNFIYGVILMIIGIAVLFCMSTIEAIFRIIIGIWIIYSAIMRLDFSFKLKSMELNTWLTVFIIAIFMLIAGIYVIANKGALIVTVGIVLLIYAIMDVIQSVIFLKSVDDIF